MRLGTSGLLFTDNSDGSICVEVVDYNIAEFDGGDWESRYQLDKENAALLFAALSKQFVGSHKQMLIAAFGDNFDTLAFEKFCKSNNIKYSHTTWTS